MFDATTAVLRESPFAAFVLLAVGLFAVRGGRRLLGRLLGVAVRLAVVALVPVVGLLFAAEVTGQSLWRDLGTGLLDAEAWVVRRLLAALDALVASLLRAVVGLVGSLAPGLPGPVAVAGSLGFLLSVFAVHVVAGAALVWAASRSADAEWSITDSPVDAWLARVGAALFAAGVLWTLLGVDAATAFTLRLAVLAAAGGVAVGVAAVLVGLRPDFSDDDAAGSESPAGPAGDADRGGTSAPDASDRTQLRSYLRRVRNALR